MIRGEEFHSIIDNIFDGDVKGLYDSEQVQANCPKCQEREYLDSPDGKYNLEINTAKGIFRCWKCDAPKFTGTLGRLIKFYGTESDYELYKSYGGSQYFDYGDDEDEVVYKQVVLPNEYIPFSKMNPDIKEHVDAYLYMVGERKIDKSVLLKYNIGFCTAGYYQNRIIIPSYDINGNLNYFVARSFTGEKPTYLNPKVDKNQMIFNEGMINWDSTIYLVEGVFEWLSFPVNTIPQLGKTISQKLFDVLINRKPEVVIVFDPDAYSNSVEIFQQLEIFYGSQSNKLKIVKLSGEYDLDEIRVNYGIDTVIDKLRTARQLEVDDFFVKRKYYVDEQPRGRRTYSGNTKW